METIQNRTGNNYTVKCAGCETLLIVDDALKDYFCDDCQEDKCPTCGRLHTYDDLSDFTKKVIENAEKADEEARLNPTKKEEIYKKYGITVFQNPEELFKELDI